MRHSASAYRNSRCHCPVCTEDHRRRHAAESATRAVSASLPHGTESGYLNWGCRCPACTAAYRLANARQRARRKLASGGKLSELEARALDGKAAS